MNEKVEDPFGMTSMFNTWMKSMGDLWGSTAGSWGDVLGGLQKDTTAGDGTSRKTQAAAAAAVKNWQAVARAMTTPESVNSLLKGSGAVPEILLGLSQASLTSFIDFQQNVIERIGRVGESAKAYQFDDIDENISRLWTDIYQKEFRQFFHIPQIGLMRTYQEKANRVVDCYNLLQSTLSELLSLLGLPFTRAAQVMQEKLGEMAESGELPDDTKVLYNMWIKVLEGHFMTLFQTPEYVETMGRTVTALADFSAARNDALEDLLSVLPVAKRTEMDGMARDLYELKKRIRKLEKAQK